MNVQRVEKSSKLWRELMDYARHCPWIAGGHLADIMERDELTDWESVFAALCEDGIVGFCTFLKTDYYPENRYSPWISSIFVDEAHRGRRISGDLISAVEAYAKERGFSKVYIPSDMTGFYEKYGFRKIDELRNYGGDIDSIFEKNL